MKFSSKENKIFVEPSKLTKELPLIAQLPFSDLESATKSVEITPISCQNCSAVLLDVNDIKKDPKIGLHFKCSFCGTINKLGSLPEGYTGGTDIEYIIEKVEVKEEPEGLKKGLQGDLVSSIIDISGSMGSGKLEAVKHNLVQSLKDMGQNSPKSGFMLITFESSVELFFSPNETALVLSNDEELHNEKKLIKYLEKESKKFSLGAVGGNVSSWVSQVSALYTKGSTALGPALVAGINIFLLRKLTGRILLLTDGLANVGFGRLEGSGSKEGKELYERWAKICLENNIVVDVIGVGGGNELALDVLGKLSELTGGELFFVSQDELDATFSELVSREFVGRDVKIKVFTPELVDIEEVSGISSLAKEAKRMQEINVGSVTRDREALVTFNVKKKLAEDEEIPIQVQVEFKDKEGNKKLRVFKTNLKPEKDQEAYKKDYDPRPLSALKVQQAGEFYGMGDVMKAKAVLSQTREVFSQNAGMFENDEEAMDSMDILADEMEQIDEFEEMKATKASASFSATMGQKRSRMSFDKKLKEMKSRKK